MRTPQIVTVNGVKVISTPDASRIPTDLLSRAELVIETSGDGGHRVVKWRG